MGEPRRRAEPLGGGAEQARVRGQRGRPDHGAPGPVLDLHPAGTAGGDVGQQRARVRALDLLQAPDPRLGPGPCPAVRDDRRVVAVAATDDPPGGQAERVGQHRARPALQVARRQPAVQEQAAARGDVGDQAPLHGRVEVDAGREREHRTARVSALRVDGAEPVAGQQQRPGQGAAGPGAAVRGQVLDDLPHDRAARVGVLRQVGVGQERQREVVVLLAHPGQPRLVRAHGRDGPRGRRVGEPAPAFRADRAPRCRAARR